MRFGELKGTFLEEYYLLEARLLDSLLFPTGSDACNTQRQIFNSAAEPNKIGEENVTGAVIADMIGKYTQKISTRSGILNSIASIPRYDRRNNLLC